MRLAVGPLTGFADKGIFLVQIGAIRADPHAIGVGAFSTDHEANPKDEKGNPHSHGHDEPEGPILLGCGRLHEHWHNDVRHQRWHPKKAKRAQASPEQSILSASSGKSANSSTRCDQQKRHHFENIYSAESVESHRQITTDSWYSPKRRRRASEISPMVA